jgi:hypothetical protein
MRWRSLRRVLSAIQSSTVSRPLFAPDNSYSRRGQTHAKRTARACLHRERLCDILFRKQYHLVCTMLRGWCTNVMRSKVEPVKKVAAMIRSHFDGIVNWTRSRQTCGLIKAINGLFRPRTVIFLIAGKLYFAAFDSHVAYRTPTAESSGRWAHLDPGWSGLHDGSKAGAGTDI